jgi:hypothetical protein
VNAPLGIGLHFDVPADVYHNDPAERPSLSSSLAHTLATKTPKHAYLRHPKLGGGAWKNPTTSMNEGALAHELILGAGKGYEVIKADNFKTKVAQELRDAAIAAGKVPVLEHAFAEAKSVAHQLTKKLSEDYGIRLIGKSEAVAIWEEEHETGPVLVRSMFDHLIESRGVIYDLKKIVSADPDTCERHAYDYGYDIQAHSYLRGLERVRPNLAGRCDFVFLFLELEPPYCITPLRPDGAFRELGRRRWNRAVNSWATSLRDNRWPEYSAKATTIGVKPWALAKEEEFEHGTHV